MLTERGTDMSTSKWILRCLLKESYAVKTQAIYAQTWHWDAFALPSLLWQGYKYYIFWMYVSSLNCTACYAHAPYYKLICDLSGWMYHISPHYLMNDTILGKKITENKMCALIFCITFVWNIFHSEKNWARYDHRCTYEGWNFNSGNYLFTTDTK